MIIDTITQAKAQLSALVSAVEQGEEVIIKKAGKPVAVLKKYDNSRKERKPGAFADKIIIKEDFDSLSYDLEEAFGMIAEPSADSQTSES
jgi:prevent-host-death family protein